jgi:hypothetical protein
VLGRVPVPFPRGGPPLEPGCRAHGQRLAARIRSGSAGDTDARSCPTCRPVSPGWSPTGCPPTCSTRSCRWAGHYTPPRCGARCRPPHNAWKTSSATSNRASSPAAPVIAGKAVPADGRSSCFGYVQTSTTANPNGACSKCLPPRGCRPISRHLPHDGGDDIRDLRATSIRRPSTCWTGSTSRCGSSC